MPELSAEDRATFQALADSYNNKGEESTEGSGDQASGSTPSEEATPDPSTQSEEPKESENKQAPAENPGGETEDKPAEKPVVSEEESPPGSLLVEIDGKEEEIPLPELIKGYQLARDAHKHIKEAIQAKEDSKVVVDGLIQDHWGTYHRALTAAFGGDTDQALNYLVQEAKALVAEYSKFEKLPREQQEVITLKRKLAEREQALADREHQIAYERESASETQAKAQALAEITTAMKQNGIRVDVRSASTRFFIQDVARKLMDAPSMETSDAVKEVLKDVSKQLEERLKIADQVDPEVIQGLLPNLAENFRKKDLNGVKQARGARVTPKEPALKHEAAKKQVVLKDGDWDTYFRSR